MCEERRSIGNGHWGSPYINHPARENFLVRMTITVLSDWIMEEAQ